MMDATNGMESTYDVLVIGGGLAGLSAVREAAANLPIGGRAALLEKSTAPGGHARTMLREGFAMNLGAHAVYKNGAAARYYRELGLELRGAAPEVRGRFFVRNNQESPDAGDSAPGEDRSGDSIWFPDALFRLRSPLSLGERYEFLRVYLTIQRARPAEHADQTIGAWLERRCKRPRVRRLLDGLVRLSTYCNAPDLLSADAALGQLQLGGVLYLDDGWKQITDFLQGEAERAGAELMIGRAARGIERAALEDDRVDSGGRPAASGYRVETDEGALFARRIVLACHPDVARRLLPESDDFSEIRERLKACLPSHAAAYDVALESLPRPGETFAKDLDKNLYLSVFSAVARLAPPDRPEGAVIHTMRYLRPGCENEESREATEELQALLDAMQPGWRERLLAEQRMPKIAVIQDIPTPERGGLAGRMPVAPLDALANGTPGLYFAGDWVGPEGMLSDAAVASGVCAGRLSARAADAKQSKEAGDALARFAHAR